ncbi:MAG: UDP-glucose--hexose-1-phosphate uridylyltransferase [Thermoflexaceae bacterium]|nr:UDP-glucose--hexose-1-phosphate uridylyltransferase [Thermoflexaceae bacterium]
MYENIAKLVQYGLHTGLIKEEDKIYATNQILEVMGLDDYEEPEVVGEYSNLEEILEGLLGEARERGLVDEGVVAGDLFDTKLMNCLMPRPSEVIAEFNRHYDNSPKEATDYFYKLSQDSNYIRRERVKRDMKWTVDSAYGEIEMSINLSKPEKDPKAIAAAKLMKQSSYPKCQLCVENEGYAGRLNHPARQNHRIIPITINDTPWGFQYSPYVYYNEHCIVLSAEHSPMKIDRLAFKKLFDFITLFPHYFVGSNADLPIVGGSILSHEHFQGGCHDFPMAKAPIEKTFTVKGFEDVEAGIVKWPLSVIRIRSEKAERLVELADHILSTWREYTDEEAFIYAETDGEPHNTITPIARMNQGKYELDLTLRNNITTKECPLGVYHPHAQYHNIKKENIGLIEVMGLAILPARLKNEMTLLSGYLSRGEDFSGEESLVKHKEWVEKFKKNYDIIGKNEKEVMDILLKEMGKTFVCVLEDAGVYKCNEQGRMFFDRFINSL